MALLLRVNKAAPLTSDETDANFVYLDSKISALDTSKLNITGLLTAMKLVDGVGSLLDADMIHGFKPYSENTINSLVLRDGTGNFTAGTITAALNGNASTASSAADINFIVPFSKGGTGVTSLTAGFISSNGTYLTSSATIPGSSVSGNITGSSGNVTGTVGILNGGTGGTTASEARINLGLIIGTTVQAQNSNLQNLSVLSGGGLMIRTTGGVFAVRSITTGSGLSIANADGTNDNPAISISNISVAQGGTGAINAAGALTNLGAAPKVSPAFTGTPTTPTAAFKTNTTQIASTAFVQQNASPIGSLILWAGLVAPAGYELCDGHPLTRASYTELFAVIGTHYGSPSIDTFNVPTMTSVNGMNYYIKA